MPSLTFSLLPLPSSFSLPLPRIISLSTFSPYFLSLLSLYNILSIKFLSKIGQVKELLLIILIELNEGS